MLKIGLTGGIGSGKSTVARIFEVLGIPVYYADEAARRLMQDDISLCKEIRENFGDESYEGNTLNRPFLSRMVFTNPKKLALLNSLVHPVTIADSQNWIMEKERSKPPPPYIIKEAALIFESGSNVNLDYVIGVSSPLPLRVSRAMARDQLTEQQIMVRISRQMEEKEKLERCDFILINDEKELLTSQVIALHERLKEMKK